MRRLKLFSFALLALAGCSGGGDGDGGIVNPPPTPTIALQVAPATVTVARGASSTTTVTLTRGGNYTGAVQLATGGQLPQGVTVTFNPAALSATTNTSVATISAGAAATGGPVQIVASGTGVTNATANVTVEVPIPTITFAVAPDSVGVAQGGTQNIALTISRAGGFAGEVKVATTGLPTGVTAPEVTIAAGATTGSLPITVGAAAAVGTSTLTLSATGTGVTAQTRTVRLTVTAAAANGFSLTASNPSLSLTAGGSATSNLTLTRTGSFAGAVALTVDGAPTGMTATVNPTSIAAGANASVLTVATTTATAPGTYNLTVSGAGTGITPNPTTVVAVTVAAPPGITITAANGAVTAAAGGSATTGLALARTNFTGDVTLTATGVPTGVTATFTPAALSGTVLASTLNLAIAANTAPGTHAIVVNASGALAGGGTTTAQTTVNLTITAAQSYTLSATAASLQQGGTGTSTVTITRAGGFAGAVTLAVSGLPTGVTAAFNPAAPTGNTSTLTFTAAAGATTGAFTATVTGTAQGLANVTTTVAGTVTASGGGGSGNVTARFCDPAEYPIWVAYRSGTTGPWTRATAGANQTYSFTIAGVGGVAWAKPDGNNGFAVTVYYGSAQELGVYGQSECTNNPSGGKTLTGTFAGLGNPLQNGQVSIGGGYAQSTFGQNGFNLTGVADGVTDLLAFRSTTAVTGTSVSITPDKGILRRNVNYPNGSAIPVLNFDGPEAFLPVDAQITVTNPAGSSLLTVLTSFQTGNGTFGGFSFGNLGTTVSPVNTVYGVPAALTQPGDFHLVQATSTVTVANVPVSSRSVTMFNRQLTSKSITLGPDLAISGTGFVTIGTTPYARLRVNGTWQAEYGDMLFGSFSQAANNVSRVWLVSATRAYFAGASTFEVEMPDFSTVAGFDNNWGLRAGSPVSFGAVAYSAGGATATTEGLVVRSAAVYGTRTP